MNVITNAEGIYLEDLDGRRYLDFHGNSVHQVGYKNPYVMDAIKRQLDELPFIPRRYTGTVAIQLARKLVELAPGDLNKVLFAPGGTSAIGMAMKLVRKATGKFKTISMWDSFHGASLDAISIGGEGVFRSGMGPLLPGTEHMMPYNSYRCMFGECSACGMKCLDYLEYMLEREEDVGAISWNQSAVQKYTFLRKNISNDYGQFAIGTKFCSYSMKFPLPSAEQARCLSMNIMISFPTLW
jgi:4-aminobutyrate aminotransferase